MSFPPKGTQSRGRCTSSRDPSEDIEREVLIEHVRYYINVCRYKFNFKSDFYSMNLSSLLKLVFDNVGDKAQSLL